MDQTWTALISGATGATVVAFVARMIIERTLRAIDELKAEVRRLHDADLNTDKRLELHIEKTDGSLKLGNQKFEWQKAWNLDIERKVRDLEIENRAAAQTIITRAS